jgi:hypothetical protein
LQTQRSPEFKPWCNKKNNNKATKDTLIRTSSYRKELRKCEKAGAKFRRGHLTENVKLQCQDMQVGKGKQ